MHWLALLVLDAVAAARGLVRRALAAVAATPLLGRAVGALLWGGPAGPRFPLTGVMQRHYSSATLVRARGCAARIAWFFYLHECPLAAEWRALALPAGTEFVLEYTPANPDGPSLCVQCFERGGEWSLRYRLGTAASAFTPNDGFMEYNPAGIARAVVDYAQKLEDSAASEARARVRDSRLKYLETGAQ